MAKRKPILQPTRTGRRLLAMIARQRAVANDDWDARPASERQYVRLTDEISRVGRAMTERRVTTLAAMVDRAILAMWWCSADNRGDWYVDSDVRGFQGAHIEATLALAGLKVADCHASAA